MEEMPSFVSHSYFSYLPHIVKVILTCKHFDFWNFILALVIITSSFFSYKIAGVSFMDPCKNRARSPSKSRKIIRYLLLKILGLMFVHEAYACYFNQALLIGMFLDIHLFYFYVLKEIPLPQRIYTLERILLPVRIYFLYLAISLSSTTFLTGIRCLTIISRGAMFSWY